MLKHYTLTDSHTLGLDNFRWSLWYVRCTFTDHEYLIINLDIPNGFGQVQWDKLQPGWPFEIALDWIRIYQNPNNIDVDCASRGMPTADSIE